MRKSKLVAALAALMFILMGAASCGSGAIARPAADEGAQRYKINGGCVLEVRDGVIRVGCSTDALNGTGVKISIDSSAGGELASQNFTKTCDNFYADFEIDPKWTGTIMGHLTIEPSANGAHSEEVIAAYGKVLQNLEGDNVIWNANGNAVVISSEKYELSK